jgi:DNA modification methylase
LRDYGTAKWEGGDPNCKHTVASGDNDRLKPDVERPERNGIKRQYCQKCGAVRIDQQIGLEQTPAEYVDNIVQVFREVWRVLRDDGTVWLNIGDSYAGNMSRASINGRAGYGTPREGVFNRGGNGIKNKDLIGIPFMVAFALRDDGWWLRQDIIWHKPNPMPESVKDRCTKAHEYIFLLSKSPRYYYDYEAVLEPVSDKSLKRAEYGWDCDRPSTKNASLGGDGIHTEKMGERFVNPAGRNRRSVWTIPTSPYRGAHYATFPPKLIEPMILAGCPQIVCAKCGAPYQRVLERADKRHWTERNDYKSGDKYKFEYLESKQSNDIGRNDAPASFKSPEMIDKGFQPTCNCNAGTTSGIVLDPFVGSGTTIMVANQLGRRGIGLDLSFKYLHEDAKKRIETVQPKIFA